MDAKTIPAGACRSKRHRATLKPCRAKYRQHVIAELTALLEQWIARKSLEWERGRWTGYEEFVGE